MSHLKEAAGPELNREQLQEVFEATVKLVEASDPMFGEQFDPHEVGGMLVTPEGLVAEVRHPYWKKDDSSPEANLHSRVTVFPIRVINNEGGSRDFVWDGDDFNPSNPTLGAERELSIMYEGTHYKITPDGINLAYPDGSTEPMDKNGFDPEAIQQMVEHGVDISEGYDDLARNVLKAHVENERWMERHDINSPNISLYPCDYDTEDWSQHWFVQRMPEIFERYGSAKEFGVMSHQLHVQFGNLEAAQHASNRYQGVQAIFGYLTSGAPIRDGDFDRKIGEHYQIASKGTKISPDLVGTEVFSPFIDHTHIYDQESGFHKPTIQQDDMLARYSSHVPYDWRELAKLGSPSAGVYTRPASVNTEEFFRRADEGHKNPLLVSSVRTLGMHSDRHRFEYGTFEVMNLGTAGGNIRKQNAVNEVVSKFFIAHHEHYMDMSDEERSQAAENYQLDCDEGHANNIFMALSGSETMFVNEGETVTPEDLMQRVIDFTNQHSPVEISQQSIDEVMATIKEEAVPEDPSSENSRMIPRWQQKLKGRSPSAIFTAFFSENSPMTATEAMRFAHEQHPELSADKIMSIFSECRRVQVYEVFEDFDLETREEAYLSSQEEHIGRQVDEVFAEAGSVAMAGASRESAG